MESFPEQPDIHKQADQLLQKIGFVKYNILMKIAQAHQRYLGEIDSIEAVNYQNAENLRQRILHSTDESHVVQYEKLLSILELQKADERLACTEEYFNYIVKMRNRLEMDEPTFYLSINIVCDFMKLNRLDFS